MPELLPCPCTIDAGCFILIDRNRFQPGRPKNACIPAIFPQIGAGQNPERCTCPHKIYRLHPQAGQPTVAQPLPGKQGLPQQHNAGHRNRNRQQKGGFEDAGSPCLPQRTAVEHERQYQAA